MSGFGKEPRNKFWNATGKRTRRILDECWNATRVGTGNEIQGSYEKLRKVRSLGKIWEAIKVPPKPRFKESSASIELY